MRRPFSGLPQTVLVLGAISFFNDIASEMVMPLLPVFLTTALGAGPAALGLIEGVADATASLLKIGAGMAADRTGHWKRFVRFGYLLSNGVRPLIGLAGSWGAVLGLRFGDRVGKGIRAAPRDAMIANAVPDAMSGRAFGFHRAMDHAGASIGPLLAFGLLGLGFTLDRIIILSVVPGIIVVLAVLVGLSRTTISRPVLPGRMALSNLDPVFKKLVLAGGGVAFAAMPDALIILWAFNAGITVSSIAILWAVAHIMRMATVYTTGNLADRKSRGGLLMTGWAYRVVILLALAFVPVTVDRAWVLFLLYATATAWTESVERAWIAELAPEGIRASLFGAYHTVTGLALLPGSALLGIIWELYGAGAAFVVSAVVTTASASILRRVAFHVSREND